MVRYIKLWSRWHTTYPPPRSSSLKWFRTSTSTFQSHLSVLEPSVRSYPTRPAFRIPVVTKENSQISEWAIIKYARFYQDVELYVRYWTFVLSADSIAPGYIIGLWYVSFHPRPWRLLDMIARCGLNRLRQFATFLGHHLPDSKTNPKHFQALVQLDEVLYSGLAL